MELTQDSIVQEAALYVQSEARALSSSKSSSTVTVKSQNHNTFWSYFDKIGQPNQTVAQGSTPIELVKSEVTGYLAFNPISRKDDPLNWWKEKKQAFPHISKLVMKYLSAPSSSVYSERLFSEKGNIYEEHRNRMLPRNGEMLAFLHHNLKLMNYNYD